MNEPLNRPKLQGALVIWGTFCLFGVLFGVWLMMDYPAGTESWQVAILLIATCAVGWVVIAAIVCFHQRQLVFVPGALLVRRWTDVLLGRPGRRIALGASPRARIFVGTYGYSGAKIEGDGESLKFPLSFWPRADARRLPEILQRHGITVEIGGSVFDDD